MLGAYFVLYPTARVRTLVFVFLVQIPAWVFLGGWFLYQLVEANFGLSSAPANGGGVAFFAHVGGFVFGAVVTAALLSAGRVVSQSLVRRPALAAHETFPRPSFAGRGSCRRVTNEIKVITAGLGGWDRWESSPRIERGELRRGRGAGMARGDPHA